MLLLCANVCVCVSVLLCACACVCARVQVYVCVYMLKYATLSACYGSSEG